MGLFGRDSEPAKQPAAAPARDGGERVEILGTGQLEGDVTAPRVVISEGAFVKGKIEMTGEKATLPGQRPAASPAAAT